MTDPYETQQPAHDLIEPAEVGRRGCRWVGFAVVGAAIAVVLAALLFIPALRRSSVISARFDCKRNIGRIAVALHDYHDEHGHFPPAFTVDENGRRLHSWRTLLLPYLGEEVFYKSIDLTKPWDDPVHDVIRGVQIPVYWCRSIGGDPTFTTYKGIVGPTAFFANDGSTRTIDDITDSTAQTLAITEVSLDRASHWMDPYNDDGADFLLNLSDDSKLGHTGGVLSAFADGAVRFFSKNASTGMREAVLSIAGGEKADDF